MDLETLSNMYLDDDFVEQDSFEEDDFLEHYGVKGMKWGVRNDKKKKSRKGDKSTSIFRGKNRRYPGENAAQYNARMKRESAERIAKINAKSQEKIVKMQLKDAEKQRSQEEARTNPKTEVSVKKNVKSMSDQEIRDAIARFRLEQDYKNEQKKANDATNGLMRKTLKGAAIVGGGILLTVGKQVVTKQLTDIGNQKLDAKFVERGWKLYSTSEPKKKKKDGD